MLNSIPNIPARYYQIILLNIGLIIAEYKDLSLLFVITSLLLIALIIAPIAIQLGILPSTNNTLIHQQIQNKLVNGWERLKSCLGCWDSCSEQRRLKTMVIGLLVIYISLNFICPCIESFIFINAGFVFLFMQQQVERAGKLCNNVCSEKCPMAC